jgi:hypothetical protein
LGLAFCAVADLLASYETSRDSWHAAAIACHSSFRKLFPLSAGEMSLLKDKNLHTISQLLEVNDLTGRLPVEEKILLIADLTPYPHLQHKLCLLINSLRCAPVVDKFATSTTTTASSLFCLDKNLSQVYKKQQRHKLHKTIQVPPSYSTRRDGITLPQRVTFLNAYKVLHMSLLPFKTKETVLNRTIWTQNKVCKSGLAPDAICFLCEEMRLWNTCYMAENIIRLKFKN